MTVRKKDNDITIANFHEPIFIEISQIDKNELPVRRETASEASAEILRNDVSEDCSQQIINRIIRQHDLSLRQAQVALKCVEGLSNAEIGAELLIQPETVKFHLRNIFVKFRIRRRTELISKLFRQELSGLIGTN